MAGNEKPEIERNVTRIELNEFMTLEITVPTETDIATYDGISEMVRKMNRVIGGIIPSKKRSGNGNGPRLTKEQSLQFVKDAKHMSSDELIEKYELKTIDEPSNFIKKKVMYIKNRYNIKYGGK